MCDDDLIIFDYEEYAELNCHLQPYGGVCFQEHCDKLKVVVHDPTVVEKTRLGHGAFARDLQLVPGARYKVTLDGCSENPIKIFVGSLRNFYVLDTLETTVTLDGCVHYCFTAQQSLTDIGVLLDLDTYEECTNFKLERMKLRREAKVNKNHPNKFNLSYLLNNDERQDVLARKTFKDDIRMETETCEGIIRRSVNECLVPIGAILPYAGDSAPCGYLLCDGTLYYSSDDSKSDLYDVIGTNYGTSGGTSFNVPDLRGRFPVGLGPDGKFDQLTDVGPVRGRNVSDGGFNDYYYTIVQYIIKSN